MNKYGVISVSYVREITAWQGGYTWPEMMEMYRKDWSLERLNNRLAKIKSLGIDYIELYKGDAGFEEWGDEAPQQIKDLHVQNGLVLWAYCVGGLNRGADFERHFQFADKLGVSLVTGTLGREPELVDKLADYCHTYHKQYAIEPHGKDTTLADPREILAAIERHPDVLGACPDMGWFAREGYNPEEAVDMLKECSMHTHFKDFSYEAKKSCAPGDGDVDMRRVVGSLLSAGYDGVWSIEWEAPYDPSEDLRRARNYIASLLGD
jgi:sugar phosphate isomerase/epimerase